MTKIYDDFRKLVTKKVHDNYGKRKEGIPLIIRISIGRVMQVCPSVDVETGWTNESRKGYATIFSKHRTIEINWKLMKENGQECDHTDQSEETILKLTGLIK